MCIRDSAMIHFLQWVGCQMSIKRKDMAVIATHNAFRSDKPLLELEFKRHGLSAPNNVYFFDSLHFMRAKLPKLKSYCLKDLYKHTYNQNLLNAHRALSDVLALNKLFDSFFCIGINMEGIVYPFYQTSLRNLHGVGEKNESIMLFHGIHSLEQLKLSLIHI